MSDENGISEVGTPYDEEAFKAMSPEARDWHIMSEIHLIKQTCAGRNVRIKKLERGRKQDTALATFFGSVAGFFGGMLRGGQ